MKLPRDGSHIVIKAGAEAVVSVAEYQFLMVVYEGIQRIQEPVIMKRATEPAQIVCVHKKRKKTK